MYSQPGPSDIKPRRGQDPRLARADPRMRAQTQNMRSADQPFASTSLQVPPAPTQIIQNDIAPQMIVENTPGPVQDGTAPQARGNGSVQSQTPNALQPLFCVVCASNQVCMLKLHRFVYK